MNRLFYILPALLLIGCRTAKKSTETHRVKVKTDTVVKIEHSSDTVYRTRVVEKTRPVENQVSIENPCDSLGNLLPFKYVFGSGNNKSVLEGKDGKLYFDQRLDSLENSLENIYKSRYKKDSISVRKALLKDFKQENEKTKVVWPWWLYVVIAIGLISIVMNIKQRLKRV